MAWVLKAYPPIRIVENEPKFDIWNTFEISN